MVTTKRHEPKVKMQQYVNSKSLLSTKPLDLISYHILSFAFKFGWLTIAMRFFEFANEFAVIPNSSEHYKRTANGFAAYINLAPSAMPVVSVTRDASELPA